MRPQGVIVPVATSLTHMPGNSAPGPIGWIGKDGSARAFEVTVNPPVRATCISFQSIASFNRCTPNASRERYVQAFAGPGTTGPITNPNLQDYSAFVLK